MRLPDRRREDLELENFFGVHLISNEATWFDLHFIHPS